MEFGQSDSSLGLEEAFQQIVNRNKATSNENPWVQDVDEDFDMMTTHMKQNTVERPQHKSKSQSTTMSGAEGQGSYGDSRAEGSMNISWLEQERPERTKTIRFAETLSAPFEANESACSMTPDEVLEVRNPLGYQVLDEESKGSFSLSSEADKEDEEEKLKRTLLTTAGEWG